MDLEQLPNAPQNEDDSDHQTEPLDGEAEILSRRLSSERNYTHAEKPYSPANVRKQSYPDPDEEDASTDGVQFLEQGARILPHLIVPILRHVSPPHFIENAKRLNSPAHSGCHASGAAKSQTPPVRRGAFLRDKAQRRRKPFNVVEGQIPFGILEAIICFRDSLRPSTINVPSPTA